MDYKALLIALGLLTIIASVSSTGVGYGLVIDHVPGLDPKFGGLGLGQSIRYVHRFYPYPGLPWIAPTVPPIVKPIVPPYGAIGPIVPRYGAANPIAPLYGALNPIVPPY